MKECTSGVAAPVFYMASSINSGWHSLESVRAQKVALPAAEHNLVTEEVHSFIPDIYIASLQVHYYSKALPTTALILCRS